MDFSEEIQEFCQIGCDRYSFLKSWLDREEIEASVIATGELNHFLIRPGGDKGYHSGEYLKTLTAHYDRYPDSPGANDNSAAVFQLLRLCRFLHNASYPHNCQVLLTDGEEITRHTDPCEQGSYRLAELFQKGGLDKTIMIILDMCGIGDTMVYSTGGEKLTGAMTGREKRLLSHLLEMIPTYSRGKSIRQSEGFSDDLGFLAHDYVTLQVSLIPWKERTQLQNGQMPESWKTMHTPRDRTDKLEPASFRIMEGFLTGVSKIVIIE